MYKYLIFLIIIFDQISKRLALEHIKSNKNLYFLSLKLSKNTGICFSLFNKLENQIVLIIISILILLFSIYIFKNTADKIERHAWKLIIGGGIGNLFDRIIFGYVIDFIQITIPFIKYEFATFNLADMAIVFGMIFLLFSTFKSLFKIKNLNFIKKT